MTEGDRVKIIRKELNLTLEKFGERIGLKKSALSLIESGRNALSDQACISICREFHVNESWLRTGEGDAFIQVSVADELSEFITSIQNDPDASFKRKLLTVLAGLTEEQWILLADIAERLARPETAAVAQRKEPVEEESIESKVEAYRRSLELEEEARAKSEVS